MTLYQDEDGDVWEFTENEWRLVCTPRDMKESPDDLPEIEIGKVKKDADIWCDDCGYPDMDPDGDNFVCACTAKVWRGKK